jgi:hypothetical protein
MRVYLDNCCYNQPFDDQSQMRISLEARAARIMEYGIKIPAASSGAQSA